MLQKFWQVLPVAPTPSVWPRTDKDLARKFDQSCIYNKTHFIRYTAKEAPAQKLTELGIHSSRKSLDKTEETRFFCGNENWAQFINQWWGLKMTRMIMGLFDRSAQWSAFSLQSLHLDLISGKWKERRPQWQFWPSLQRRLHQILGIFSSSIFPTQSIVQWGSSRKKRKI